MQRDLKYRTTKVNVVIHYNALQNKAFTKIYLDTNEYIKL